ncbi:hypothetical protein ACFFJT_10055 [Dyella flava]|uniref:Uncharacterized protein n=1 Tax=Dyella flava TaxID=1920170 RepID=A0ABS2K259_9GAMM|nr:hypothetical protein [Dyella flava]MBM7125313.1 hypothetical protein [Dyella flava]GLQ50638.1 hypothetical protein GCM10010872_20870 [Dyella flava]
MYNMTNKHAYAAMFYFLDMMHSKFGWKELGPLLGSMSLIDGIPADEALLEDWEESVKRSANGIDVGQGTLTEQQAYAAMSNFLNQMYQANQRDVGSLIKKMSVLNGDPCDAAIVEVWEKAIEFASRGGEAPSLILKKGDVSYEVHRGSPKSNKD